MIPSLELCEFAPPTQCQKGMLGTSCDRVAEGCPQAPHRFGTTRNYSNHAAFTELQIRIAGKRMLDAGLAGMDRINSEPSTRIGIYNACLADDAFREAVLAKTEDLLVDLFGE